MTYGAQSRTLEIGAHNVLNYSPIFRVGRGKECIGQRKMAALTLVSSGILVLIRSLNLLDSVNLPGLQRRSYIFGYMQNYSFISPKHFSLPLSFLSLDYHLSFLSFHNCSSIN